MIFLSRYILYKNKRKNMEKQSDVIYLELLKDFMLLADLNISNNDKEILKLKIDNKINEILGR